MEKSNICRYFNWRFICFSRFAWSHSANISLSIPKYLWFFSSIFSFFVSLNSFCLFEFQWKIGIVLWTESLCFEMCRTYPFNNQYWLECCSVCSYLFVYFCCSSCIVYVYDFDELKLFADNICINLQFVWKIYFQLDRKSS